jgi:hypothetical protein
MSPSSMQSSDSADEIDHHDILRRFESCTLPPAELNHRRHLALGWLYLRMYGFPLGVVEFQSRLRAYVNAVGATSKYHETVTWAYMILMNEEMQLRAAPDEGFEVMIQRRPDLLDHRSGALAACYPSGQLDAADCRRVFMLPRHDNVAKRT